MTGTRVRGSAGISASDGDTFAAGYTGQSDEFDKASRSSKEASFTSKAWTLMTAWTSTTDDSSSASEFIEECSISVSAKDKDESGSPDSGKWKIGCKKGALAQTGLSANQQADLVAIFEAVKPKSAKPDSLSYSGKTKDN